MFFFTRLYSTGFCAGIALSLPFWTDIFSKKYLFFLVIPFLISLYRARGRWQLEFRGISGLLVLLATVAAINVVTILFSSTPFVSTVVWDVLGFACIALVYCLVERSERESVVEGVLYSLVIFATIAASLGLIKYFLQERGYLFDFILLQCADRYPQGTNLCADYNLVGMSFLIASIALVRNLVKQFSAKLIVLLIVILTAGVLLGSRRFLVLSMLVPAYALSLSVIYGQYNLRRVVATMGLVLVGIFLLAKLSTDEKQSGLYAAGRLPYTILSSDLILQRLGIDRYFAFDGASVEKTHPRSQTAKIVAPNSTNPVSIIGTIDGSTAFGFDSRLGRWVSAVLLSRENDFLPLGFDYHYIYSCDTGDCSSLNYPHSTILSGLLIGGLGFGFLILGFYVLLGVWTFRSGFYGWKTGSSMLVILIAPYSLISGDTLFSLPHIVVCAFIVAGMAFQVDEKKWVQKR